MDGYTIKPNRWTRMQDPRLARSEDLAGREMSRRTHCDPRTPDRIVLARLLREAASGFLSSWNAARERRHALRALKRVDRRLLMDLGMDRARLREVVDAMVARREAAERAKPQTPALAASAWMGNRATAS